MTEIRYEELRRVATLLLKARRAERSSPGVWDRLRSEAIRLLSPWTAPRFDRTGGIAR